MSRTRASSNGSTRSSIIFPIRASESSANPSLTRESVTVRPAESRSDGFKVMNTRTVVMRQLYRYEGFTSDLVIRWLSKKVHSEDQKKPSARGAFSERRSNCQGPRPHE